MDKSAKFFMLFILKFKKRKWDNTDKSTKMDAKHPGRENAR